MEQTFEQKVLAAITDIHEQLETIADEQRQLVNDISDVRSELDELVGYLDRRHGDALEELTDEVSSTNEAIDRIEEQLRQLDESFASVAESIEAVLRADPKETTDAVR